MKSMSSHRLALLFIPIIVFSTPIFAQPAKRKPASKTAQLFQVHRYYQPYDRSFGFINSTGNFVIDYDKLPKSTRFVGSFHEGLATIHALDSADDTTRVGYINESGDVVIEPRYIYARDFSEGLAYVESREFRGFINKKGDIVIKLDRLTWEFQALITNLRARDFHEGLAAVGSARWASDFSYGDDSVMHGGRWGYIDRTGRLVIKPKYEFAETFSEGLAAVVIDNRYGFIDRNGRMVIKPQFQPKRGGSHGFGIGGASLFHEGLACVQSETGSFGYINKSGKYVVLPVYAAGSDFSEGLAGVVVREGVNREVQKIGWIDKTGKFALEGGTSRDFSLLPPHAFSNGLVPFAIREGPNSLYLWGYMDRKGVTIIEPSFHSAYPFVNGVAFVMRYEPSNYRAGITTGSENPDTKQFMEEVYGYIDRKGRFIWRSMEP